MEIEVSKDEIAIRLPAWVNKEGIENLLYSEATSKSKGFEGDGQRC